MNADEILKAASEPEFTTRFERYLEAQGEDVQRLFWDVVERGYVEQGAPSRGCSGPSSTALAPKRASPRRA